MSHHPLDETPVTTERFPGIGRSFELTDLDGDRVSVVFIVGAEGTSSSGREAIPSPPQSRRSARRRPGCSP